jgi:hypothetical protein
LLRLIGVEPVFEGFLDEQLRYLFDFQCIA